jgi:4-hydroxythreonine-4-phosphate dehydrogenase
VEGKNKLKIGISLGDFNGIGPEVILKTLADNRLLNHCVPIIYASGKLIDEEIKSLGLENFTYQLQRTAESPDERNINVVDCLQEDFTRQPGQPTPESGKAALKSLMAACEDLKSGRIDGLVTAPIDKDNIQAEDFHFPGHTEFLTSFFGAPESLMFLVSERLRVATVTGHLPLKDVVSRLTPELIILKTTLLLESLKKDFGILKPRVAILGFNPHAGENGLLGKEEAEIIIPAMRQLKDRGHLVFGPYPADGFFGTGHYRQVDAVLAMYHDQGLIPFKTLAFEDGVNFTAGLPIVRTSPDHGTAYDIAGKNRAHETSFREALFLACDIIRKRMAAPVNPV